MSRALAHARSKARQQRFLNEFQRTGIVSEAAKHADVDRMTVYHHWLKEERFRKEFESIREGWLDRLEGELMALGTGKYMRTVSAAGKVVHEPIRDVRALELLLKAYRPLFRERVAMEMSGSVTQNVKVTKRVVSIQLVADVSKILAEAGVSFAAPPENEQPLGALDDLKARRVMKLLEQPLGVESEP
ncbi:MAG TPA: hypothetical protein VNZ26_25785 [Vicinamibacterales bacterium]|jgi:hypothetical protein|nr:hypothetical protein [Vicinamibacterales bacterium]